MYPHHAPRSIYRHCKQKPTEKVDKRKSNSRPKNLLARHLRIVVRCVETLRKDVGNNFGAKKVQREQGIDHVCNRAIWRCLKKNGYLNLPLRKKGIVIAKDCKKRRSFSQKCLKKLRPDIWTKCVSFYLDSVGFTDKCNPMEYAKSVGPQGCRKRNEGLSITAKDKKEGMDGRTAHFFVGISYTKGVVLCEQYFEKINGPLFANISRKTFPDALAQSVNPKNKLILQDGDPSQNSKCF